MQSTSELHFDLDERLCYGDIEESRQITYDNIQYGMMVEVAAKGQDFLGGYHSGCKVHFFNRKGVLIGNYYEFVPYERLRRRLPYQGGNRDYQRFFFEQPLERVKFWLFLPVLRLVTVLMKFTQKYMD